MGACGCGEDEHQFTIDDLMEVSQLPNMKKRTSVGRMSKADAKKLVRIAYNHSGEIVR